MVHHRHLATARDTSSLDDLVERSGDAILPIALDVNDREPPEAYARIKESPLRVFFGSAPWTSPRRTRKPS